MKIVIEKHSYVHVSNFSYKKGDMEIKRDFFKTNEGKALSVDTKHLFDNQFNVNGYRVYGCQITEVIKDVRPRKDYSDYFLKYSKKPEIKEFSTEIEGYSFYSVNGQYYRLSRRNNLEFIFKNNDIYIKGIGFNHISNYKFSKNEIRLIKKCIDYINSL